MLIKLEWLRYRTVKKNYDHMLSRFHLIPERYGRIDRRKDRFAKSISRVSMLTRDKNSRVRRIHMLKPTVQQYQQCCHLANGNKTCCSLLLLRRIMGRVDLRRLYAKVHETWHHCIEQPSVLNKFFSELQYAAAFGRQSRKVAGRVWKYAKFRHFLAHPVV